MLPAPLEFFLWSAVAGLSKARRQLEVAGMVLTWLVHVANPQLAANTQLRLRGVLGVQGPLTVQQLEAWNCGDQRLEIWVPSLCARADMELELFES